MSRLTKSKSIITGRLLGFRVQSGLTSKRAFVFFPVTHRIWGLTIYILRIFQYPQIHMVILIFEDYRSSIDNAGQTREISLSTGSVWSCTEVHAQHIHTGIYIYAAGLFGSDIDMHNRIFFFMTRDPLVLAVYRRQLHFQVYCQGKAGQGHRIESTAWYAQTIVYYTIFPNKNKWKRLMKKTYLYVVVFSPTRFKKCRFGRQLVNKNAHTSNILRTLDQHI